MAGRTQKPKSIELKPVESSAIAAIGHDPETKTLAVKFNTGAVYHYSDVEAEKHGAFVTAESIGRHFLDHIRGKHDYIRVD